MTSTSHHNIHENLARKLLQHSRDRLYLVDIASRICTEYTADDFTTVHTQEYDAWLIALAQEMYKPDTSNFFSQMNMEMILAYLQNANPYYTVYFRTSEHDHIHEYALRAFYLDEKCNTLALMRQ